MPKPIQEIRFVPNGESRRITRLKSSALTLASIAFGALLSLVFAPYSMWHLIAPSLLWLAFCLDYFSVKKAIWHSFLYALGLWGSSVYWIFYSLYNYGNAGVVVSALMIFVMSLALAVIFASLVWLYKKITGKVGLFGYIVQPTVFKILMFGSLWAAYESLRELLTFPWLGLGNIAIDAPLFLNNWLPIIGANGTSFLIAITCSASYFCIKSVVLHRLQQKPFTEARQPIIILACILLASAGTWALPEGTTKNGTTLTVGLIQPNIELASKWNGNYTFSHIEQLFQLSLPLSNTVDLIIWPESAIAATYQRFSPLLDSITKKLAPAKLLTGSLRRNPTTRKTHNSIFLNDGTNQQIYDKQTLVPYGEFIPFVNQLRFLIQLIGLPELDLTAGPLADGTMRVNDFRLSSSICYEIIFPAAIAKATTDADAILSISDDGWFGPTIGPAQHYQMAKVRARENGRYLIRVANNGTTAIVDNKGVEVTSLPRFTQDALVAEVPSYSGRTIYSLISSWLHLPMILLAPFLCWVFRRANRKKINL